MSKVVTVRKYTGEDQDYEMKLADEYNFQKTREFMDTYFKSPEYVAELEFEVTSMLAEPAETVAVLAHGLVKGTMKGIE
jgi:hypothetical protein